MVFATTDKATALDDAKRDYDMVEHSKALAALQAIQFRFTRRYNCLERFLLFEPELLIEGTPIEASDDISTVGNKCIPSMQCSRYSMS